MSAPNKSRTAVVAERVLASDFHYLFCDLAFSGDAERPRPRMQVFL
jgi:hypothetical protein